MPTWRDQLAVVPRQPGIRLAIVDDQQMVLSGLKAWLGQAGADIGVVIAAPSWAELISHPAFPVDVVLLDLDLRDGIPAPVKISTLRQAGVAVIMISNLADPAQIKACLEGGAASSLPKSEVAEEIRADILGRGVSERGVFRQHYDTDALDASTLLIPLVRFLPSDDERVRATVLAIASELQENGFVLRYRVQETDDGLSGE